MATSIWRSADPCAVRFARAARSRRIGIPIGLFSVVVAGLLVSRSSVFDVGRIEVSGTRHLRPAVIIERSGVSKDTNALWLNEGEVALRLEADPWIASAQVTTAFPTTVRIVVVERSPVAVTRTSAGRVLVASDGTLLGPEGGSAEALPTIVVPAVSDGMRRTPLADPARAVAVLDDGGVLGLRAVVVASDGTLTARLAGGALARLGRADELRAKARALAEILAWSWTDGPPLRTIDVSAPSAPAVTTEMNAG